MQRLNRFALWLGWLFSPAALVGLLSPFLAVYWTRLDVFSQFALHSLVFLISLLLASWWRRRFVVVFMVAALLGGLGVFGAPILGQKLTGKALAGPGELGVLSFNLHGWANTDLDPIEAMLRGEKADIVLLLEFTPEQAPLLARLRGIYPYQADCAGHGLCRMALLSRHRLSGVRLSARDHGQEAPTMARAIVSTPQGEVRFFGVHLTRPLDPRGQRAELRHVGALVQELRDKPKIVAGDFNSVPWSANLRRFQHQTGLTCLNRMTPSWPMQPVGLAQFPIDQICISGRLRPLSFTALPATGSDHRPVRARLGLYKQSP